MRNETCFYLTITKLLLLFVLGLTIPLVADTITIYNKTVRTVFVATYYKKNKAQATRYSDIQEMGKGASLSLDRPVRKFGYDRELFFSVSRGDLKEQLTSDDIQKVSLHNIGFLQGRSFYIVFADFRLRCFNAAEWYMLTPFLTAGKKIIETAIQPIQDLLKKTELAIVENPYKHRSARIRYGNELCSQEKEYLKVRRPKVKAALESILGKKLVGDAVPTIAIICSGGGVRAMLATLGFLIGLEKIKLLNAVTYICTLSGSTWAVAPWISSGWPIEDIKVALLPELSFGLTNVRPNDAKLMADALLVKWSFGQPITLVDFYGTLLANNFLHGFGDKRQRIYLSAQEQTIKTGDFPLPIYTAVRGEEAVEPAWYEFTPYEIGSAWLKHYVPTWAYGRKFVRGVSKDYASEQSLGFLMGTFGSAFSATFNRMYKEIVDQIPTDIIKKIIEALLKEVGEKRLTAATVFNFTYGLLRSPIFDRRVINLVDAALDFNVPYPPISGERPERKADIIIFLDASKDLLEKANALKGAEDYARKHNLPFPAISYKDVKNRALSIFKDKKNVQCPIVVYMPLVKDEELIKYYINKNEFVDLKSYVVSFNLKACMKSTCDTFNFTYNKEQANQLSSLTEFNIRAVKNDIVRVIDEAVSKKS